MLSLGPFKEGGVGNQEPPLRPWTIFDFTVAIATSVITMLVLFVANTVLRLSPGSIILSAAMVGHSLVFGKSSLLVYNQLTVSPLYPEVLFSSTQRA